MDDGALLSYDDQNIVIVQATGLINKFYSNLITCEKHSSLFWVEKYSHLESGDEGPEECSLGQIL